MPIFKAKKLILAGGPMQLPPNVLFLNNRQKKKDSAAAKTPGKKPVVAKARSGPNEKSASPDPPFKFHKTMTTEQRPK